MPRVTTMPRDYVPNWMPLFPADSVRSRVARTQPIGWVCPSGHRHSTKACDR